MSSTPDLDKGFWNVASIREPQVPRPDFLRYAKRCHEVICKDRENVDPAVPSRTPRTEDIVTIFRFVEGHPGEPVKVHCLAGLSRSTAVALALIVGGMIEKGWKPTESGPLVERAVDLLLHIRRKIRPNALFLRLCLE